MSKTILNRLKDSSTGEYLATLKQVYGEKGLIPAINHELYSTGISIQSRADALTHIIGYAMASMPDAFGDDFSEIAQKDLESAKKVLARNQADITNKNLLEDRLVPGYFPESEASCLELF
ncbi:MAG TPA: hypothetical protein VHA12_03220 [Candidatus Nanoarchaeia archaeon]|nr:hypothetical protein [Candidatus Nanoarchaeia archaeon]